MLVRWLLVAMLWHGVAAQEIVAPDVVGLTLTEAKTKLKAHGYQLGDVNRQHSDIMPKDLIISQWPEAGKRTGASNTISVVVSSGRGGAQQRHGLDV